MEIQHLIIFCGIQIIGLLLILLRPKFRTFPNYMLMIIIINIVLHYVYYYCFYERLISYSSELAYTIVPLAAMSPLIVYYYVMSVLYGKLNFTKKSVLHYIPILFMGIFFIFFLRSEEHKENWLYTAKSILVILYGVYPFLIVKMIANFYGLEKATIKVFSYNKKKTSLIKLLWSMMIVHFLLLIVKVHIPLFIGGVEKIMDIINVCFLMFLGYALSYVIVSEPKTIHISKDKVGLGGFKKYEKSKSTRSIVEENARILNEIMEKQKPYLDSEFNLTQLSEFSNIPAYEISETLNGLIGQNFNDYVNNYRVEEFKSMLKFPEYRNFTILAIAFEAGFKSKATFNVAFKKFTGKTPSEYKKSL